MAKQQGNVLFLILIAVALFAALSYAVTSSTRSGGGNADNEKLLLSSTEMLQYVTAMRTAINRMMIANGCDISQISFERPPFDGSDPYFVNTNNAANHECFVFHPDGGGLHYWGNQDYQIIDKVHGSFAYTKFIGTWGGRYAGDPAKADLMILLSMNNPDLCKLINERLGITNPGGILPKKDGSHIHIDYTGTVDAAAAYEMFDSATGSTLEPGHEAACVDYSDRNPPDGMQIFYAILVAR